VCLDAKIGRESVQKVGERKIPGILKIKVGGVGFSNRGYYNPHIQEY
jgi:hypothetical protein